MEEANMEEDTSLSRPLLAILATPLMEDTKPPNIQETTLRQLNKPIRDLLYMPVAAYSATVGGQKRRF